MTAIVSTRCIRHQTCFQLRPVYLLLRSSYLTVYQRAADYTPQAASSYDCHC